ncbi:MAG TPA: putative lipid II flippase FtsW [Candidatus Jacksonbacteria bacterium]|uniref:Probable peptidoglycan glycosyltransferase FtsW n=1 Tax=Candidatus Falkowbacteria bacterium GW2011_GWA2_41_14 TaxID=1618635 RepID=A0A0G0X4G3_9BACT|nr:MAG: Stage V sporulation protein E [Candidatus Falkowbacteria bacterium GW2011_GWA2_41_14]HAZ16853.1 putative lipid II flippase FtsW [Candidatus Jacksonbacteria bacterium]
MARKQKNNTIQQAKQRYHRPDWVLFGMVIALVVLGCIMLSSASVVVASDRFSDSYYYIKLQIVRGIVPGLLLAAVFSFIDYHVWRKFAKLFLIIALILLVVVLIPGIGTVAGGAQRWIGLGYFSFQPSEIVKLFLVIYLAAWMTKHQQAIKETWKTFLPFLSLILPVGLLMVLQPDIGTFGLIAVVALAMYSIAHAPWRQIGAFVGIGIAFIAVIAKIEPYRLARLLVFMNPNIDPQGIGYQLNQSLLAVGSGGLWGMGLGRSRQKYQFLPEVMGDSIFAVMAEELGFFLTLGVLALFVVLVYRGMLVAGKAPDDFGKFLTIGLVLWVGFQAGINICAMLGIFPLTGVPLPFISYGSTAMVSTLVAMGIVMNVSRQTR